MRIDGLALTAALLVSVLTPASAAMRISEDRGGQIGRYLQTFATLRSSGERVIIDGNCLSACTLVLGMIPRNRICATPRARLGFHAAWMPGADGRPVTSKLGTRALWNRLSELGARLARAPRRAVAPDDLLAGPRAVGLRAELRSGRHPPVHCIHGTASRRVIICAITPQAPPTIAASAIAP